MESSNININLLTVKDVCKRLTITRTTLSTLRKDNKIHASKIGNAVRFTESEIIRFINSTLENSI